MKRNLICNNRGDVQYCRGGRSDCRHSRPHGKYDTKGSDHRVPRNCEYRGDRSRPAECTDGGKPTYYEVIE